MNQGKADGAAGWCGLVAALSALRDGLLRGDPSDRFLARALGASPTTVGSWLAGTQFPKDEDRFVSVVRVVASRATARAVVPGGAAARLLDEDCWREAYRAEARRRAGVLSAGVQRGQAV